MASDSTLILHATKQAKQSLKAIKQLGKLYLKTVDQNRLSDAIEDVDDIERTIKLCKRDEEEVSKHKAVLTDH